MSNSNIDIEKIEMPDVDVFYKEYMAKLKPVVITDFFREHPVQGLKKKEDVIKYWGDVRIAVEDEYTKAYFDSASGKSQLVDANQKTPTISIEDYFEFVRNNPTTKKMCIEFSSPEKIKGWYSIPTICKSMEDESKEFVNQCFVGNKGNFAAVHFDKAGTHGFLYQVFGEKRFISLPHSASLFLTPFTQFGGIHLHNFSERDRKDFLRLAGGKEVVLKAGDCMYVPSLSWHYVDYMEDSMSISLRFRRSNIVTELVNSLFPDMYMQGIAYIFSDYRNFPSQYAWALEDIRTAMSKSYINGKEKVKKIRKLTLEIYRKLYPNYKGPYFFDLEEYFPQPLPHFLDTEDPLRPNYA